ncbi:hypothetical protein [Noviherbaspirillum aerium]|uniref:hypothetical protein n=1 Tax=Noviherbaspirillum aerium TaxID=2588497 RepID=UPI00124E4B2D|nr:hypothetical protein [Noviherbaspirillum aerium]
MIAILHLRLLVIGFWLKFVIIAIGQTNCPIVLSLRRHVHRPVRISMEIEAHQCRCGKDAGSEAAGCQDIGITTLPIAQTQIDFAQRLQARQHKLERETP